MKLPSLLLASLLLSPPALAGPPPGRASRTPPPGAVRHGDPPPPQDPPLAVAEEPPPTSTPPPPTPAEPVAAEPRPAPPRRKGIAGRFAHAALGGGLAFDPRGRSLSPEVRFTAGGTAYALLFYAGGGVDFAHTGYTPFSATGVGRFGLALPLPRAKFLVGVKAGGGGHFDSAGPGPQLLGGSEVGLAFFGRGKRGVRVMFELEGVGKPTKNQGYAQWGLSVGFLR